MAERLKFSKKTKYITTYYYYVKELVNKNIILIKYISIMKIIIDVLTKPVGKVKFNAFIKEINIV